MLNVLLEIFVAFANLEINPLWWLLLGLFVIFVYQALKTGKVLVNPLRRLPIWIFLFSGLLYAFRYSRLYNSRLISCGVYYCLNMVIIYDAGYSIIYINRRKAEQALQRIMAAIAIGCIVHVALNVAANIGVEYRQTADFFLGDRAATNLGSINSYIYGLLPCLILIKDKRVKLAGFMSFILALIYSFLLGTRSQLYALVLMLAMSAVLYMKKHFINGIPVKRILKWLLIIIGLITTLMVAFKMNIGGIRTKFMSTTIVNRYLEANNVASNNARIKLLTKGLSSLYDYPFGGNKSVHYFHNYWLDIGRVAGTLPVLMVVLMDAIFVVHMFRLFNLKTMAESTRYAVLGIYICILLNFCVEPIMDGYMELLYRFTLINGMVEGLYDISIRKRRGKIRTSSRIAEGLPNYDLTAS